MRCWLFLVFTVFLTSCSSGGDGSDSSNNGGGYKITLDKQSVDFSELPSEELTSSAEVTASFNGDGVIVGYPPGHIEPPWLNIEEIGYTAATVRFALYRDHRVVTDPGNYSTTLRFVTGNAQSGQSTYVDLPVTLTIEEAFGVSTPLRPNLTLSAFDNYNKELAFWSIGEDPNTIHPKEDVYFTIHGTKSIWTASTDVNWLVLSQNSGDGRTKINLSVTKSDLSFGLHTAEITIIDSESGNKETLPVQFDYQPNNIGRTALDSTPWNFDFIATNTLVDEFNSNIYFTDKNAKKLFIVDSVSGLAEKTFDFEWMPWRVALNPANNLLYIILLERAHSAYYWMESQRGRIAILDLQTQTVIDEFRMHIAPGDILITEDDRLIIGGGSDQHPPVVQYHAITGLFEQVRIASASPVVRMELTPNQPSFIYRCSWRSPNPVYKASLSNQVSPYDEGTEFTWDHGDRNSSTEFWMTPGGDYLLHSNGDIYTTNDVEIVTRLTEPYVYVQAASMNKTDNKMLVLDTNNRLLEYIIGEFESPIIVGDNIEPAEQILHLNNEYRALRKTDSGTTLDLLSW